MYILCKMCELPIKARVAELVDAIDSKSIDGNIMRVRFSPRAQSTKTCVNMGF